MTIETAEQTMLTGLRAGSLDIIRRKVPEHQIVDTLLDDARERHPASGG